MGVISWFMDLYGRYNELVFMGLISWFTNQRSHIWEGPSFWGFDKDFYKDL